jgi:hypothetical protein
VLPDIVDGARAAAEIISPASGPPDPVRGRWTEHDGQRFRDCLLEILRNEREFDRRLPS